MELKIRTAIPDDTEELKRLMVQLCEAQGVEFSEKRFKWGIQRRMYDRLQKHGLIVAENPKEPPKLGGMVFGELIISPHGFAEGYIRTVITDREARGLGLGKALIQKTIEYLKSMGAEVIHINATEKQKEFYKRFGFKEAYSVLELY